MAYKKRMYKKRTGKVAPKTAKAVKKIVKKELHKQIEDKNVEISVQVNEQFLDPLGNVFNLIDITSYLQNGSQDGQRVGSRVLPKSMSVRCNLRDPDTQSGVNNNFRIVIFRWHPDETNYVPTSQQIFQGQGTLAPYNPDTRDQFTVLLDKQYNAQDLISGAQKHNFTLNKKLNLKQYMNFQATNSGKCTNDLFMIVQSDIAGTPSDTTPVVNIQGLMFYEDA